MARYKHAVDWIAVNDNAGSADGKEEIAGYVTTLLVADIFDKDEQRVARDIWRSRRKYLQEET